MFRICGSSSRFTFYTRAPAPSSRSPLIPVGALAQRRRAVGEAEQAMHGLRLRVKGIDSYELALGERFMS